MGRRPYMVQMALGRSAFETLPEELSTQNDEAFLNVPQNSNHTSDDSAARNSPYVDSHVYQQQYDNQGYPEFRHSRYQSRQSRRAMNDVLATVGVCVGTNADDYRLELGDQSKSALDKTKIDDVVNENLCGFILNFSEDVLSLLASITAEGLRCRIQTFRFYSMIPMVEILRSEQGHLGITSCIFKGMPALLTSHGLKLALESAYETDEPSKFIQKEAESSLIPKIPSIFLRALVYIFLAPLEMYAILQRLDLLPGWPWIPHPKVLVPFTSCYPLRLLFLSDSRASSSILQSVLSVVMNPVLLYWVQSALEDIIADKLKAYIWAITPKPYALDPLSLAAIREEDMYTSHVPGLCFDSSGHATRSISNSFLEEVAKDLQYIGRTFQIYYDRVARIFARKPGQTSVDPRSTTIEGSQQITDTELFDLLWGTPPAITPDAVTPPHSPRTTNFMRSEAIPIYSRSTLRTNPRTSAQGQSVESVPITRPSDTFPRNETVDRESSNRTNAPPVYRVTSLTAYGAESASSHLARHITTILLLPLEALFVRTLARQFLSAPRADPAACAAAARWKAEVFPLGGWCGMGLRGRWLGIWDYASKMVLISGFEMGMSFAIWQICTGIASFSGKRFFGWGRL